MALVPAQNEDIIVDVEEVVQPTFTWKVRVDGDDGMAGSINGNTENAEAVAQMIYLMLNTERNKFKIFGDSGYGIEHEDLPGMPIPYVVPEIDRRYREAISRIPEVVSVGNFAFSIPENRRDVLIVKLDVQTPYGNITVESGVAL